MPICMPPSEILTISPEDHTLIDLGWGLSGGTLKKRKMIKLKSSSNLKTQITAKNSAKLRFFRSKMIGFADETIGLSMGNNFVVTNGSGQHSFSGLCPVNQLIHYIKSF